MLNFTFVNLRAREVRWYVKIDLNLLKEIKGNTKENLKKRILR
jgi:hypothetical protein